MIVLISDDLRNIFERKYVVLGVQDHINFIGEYNNNGAYALQAINQLTSDLVIQENKMQGMRDIEAIKGERKDNDKLHLMILTVYALIYYRH